MAKQKKITIVFYDEGAPGETPLGGGQLARLNLMQRMDKNRFRPILLTSQDNVLADTAREKGLEVIIHPVNHEFKRFDRAKLLRNPLNFFRVITRGLRASFRLASMLKKLNADIVNPNENLSRVVTLIGRFLHLHNIPCVCHIDNEWNKGFIDQIMGRMFTVGFDRLIAVSKKTFDIAAGYTRHTEKISIIPTGVPLKRFDNCQPDYLRHLVKAKQNCFLLGTVGKLVRFKGQFRVMTALASIRDKVPAFRYILIGDGPDRKALQAHAEKLGIGNYIHFLGYRHDVPDLMCGLDALVQASDTESWGLSVLEGMMVGLPVIATDVGGGSEIMDGGRLGWLIPPGDDDALARVLLEVMNMARSERKKRGAAAKEFVTQHYSFEKTVKLTEEVYLSLLRHKK